ncbi:FAD:protein FMN transferase [uncultured Alistipes sp.]|uniref:FAD:protein FMN transferase n=1 Tax=uncultured Alistipes sp. TaxID=538949 RepID=UPI00262E5111|nr:FAD:protein FMN transferase [uncultured Alistipes sp.]
MKSKILTACLLFLGCVACSDKSGERSVLSTFDGFAQGTTYHIVVKSDRSVELGDEIDSLLRGVDRSMSLYDAESLLSRLNRNETDSVDGFIARCMDEARRIAEQTGGLYDVTVKPLTSAYGFAGEEAVARPNVDSLLELVGYRKVSVENGRLVKADDRMQIDLNSIAQGATSDYIAGYIDSLGFSDYLVEVGGEIFSRGTNASGKPWVVGIDRPVEGNFTPGAHLQVKIGLSGRGLATSGNYRKFYTDDSGRKIVHTVDPLSGEPVVSNLLSATVVAPTATLADAYGTALMVMGLERSKAFLETLPDVEAYLVYSDERGEFRTYATPGMEALVVR